MLIYVSVEVGMMNGLLQVNSRYIKVVRTKKSLYEDFTISSVDFH